MGRLLVLSAVAWCSALIVIGCGNSSGDVSKTSTTKRAAAGDKEGDVELLFVQRAATGTLRAPAGGDGPYQLDLASANPQVEWFTNRPGRSAGRMGGELMLGLFGWTEQTGGLGDNPPNLVLNAHAGDETEVVDEFAAELMHATVDSSKGTARYELQPLDGSSRPKGVTRLRDVALFVDGVGDVRPISFYSAAGGMLFTITAIGHQVEVVWITRENSSGGVLLTSEDPSENFTVSVYGVEEDCTIRATFADDGSGGQVALNIEGDVPYDGVLGSWGSWDV